MIRIENLEKSFNRNQVLKNINLEIPSGGINAILGPNGSGKTTLIKCLIGLVLPDHGALFIQDEDIYDKWMYRNDISYLPQIAKFPENLTVRELVKMVKDIRQQPAPHEDEIIQTFGLEVFLEKKIRNLSGGTRQKVNILLNLMFNTSLIILDEPTAGLDPVARIRLKEMILRRKATGKTILFTTHIMSLVEDLADDIIFLLEGSIHYQGTLEDMIRKTGESNLEHAMAHMLLKNNERNLWTEFSQESLKTGTN
jgi:Cu-processing system ATP-binding protein